MRAMDVMTTPVITVTPTCLVATVIGVNTSYRVEPGSYRPWWMPLAHT